MEAFENRMIENFIHFTFTTDDIKELTEEKNCKNIKKS